MARGRGTRDSGRRPRGGGGGKRRPALLSIGGLLLAAALTGALSAGPLPWLEFQALASPPAATGPAGTAAPATAAPATEPTAAAPPAAPGAAPRPLTARGLANLLAFETLLGDVRYFHPSSEAAGVDWDRFTLAAIGPVEAAPDAAALRAVLERLFLPIAPTVRIFPASEAPPPFTAAAAPAARVIAWRHYGLWAPARRSRRSSSTATASAASRRPSAAASSSGTWPWRPPRGSACG